MDLAFRCAGGFVASFVLLTATGCTNTEAVQEQASTIKPLAVLYGKYIGEHRGQPPASEAEFKAYVQANGKPILDANKISDADSLFTSSRDHQPYVILYGPLKGPPGPAGQPVFAYEKVGVNGKRYVASSLGAVEEVDDAKFKELVPAAP